MNIKKNDKVKILSGKDKNKIGKVLQVLPKEAKVSIEGLNLLIKHLRPQKQGEKGQRIQFPAPINSSSVALICPKCNKTTRIGSQTIKPEDSSKKRIKNRVCKKCNEVI